MLTRTSELAIRSLIFLGLEGDSEPFSPGRIAERLDCSPSYLSKTLGQLVKAGILRSVRGAHGGVVLARSPAEISLLDIVQACQGLLIGNYCEVIASHREPVCGFHQAMKETHQATVSILSRWTLDKLLDRPIPDDPSTTAPCCKMLFTDCEKYAPKKAPGET